METITRRTARSELAFDEIASFMQIDSFGMSALHLYNEDSVERAKPSLLLSVSAGAVLEDSFLICQRLSLKFD